jgi:hypothetical protein
MVQVHHSEGVGSTLASSHARVGREAAREALTGKCVGQPLNRELEVHHGADHRGFSRLQVDLATQP